MVDGAAQRPILLAQLVAGVDLVLISLLLHVVQNRQRSFILTT